jgi:uncharacterized caspase-like protein
LLAVTMLLPSVAGSAPVERGAYLPVRDASTTSVAADGATNTGGRWALIIGCNSYDPTEVGPLSVAVADAVRMRETLIQEAGYPPQNVILLTDQGLLTGLGQIPDRRPTYTTMRGQIARFVQAHKASDALLVFFAGHGFHSTKTGKDYLAPLDVQRADLDHTAIGVDELLDQLRESGAQQCVLIADACRNVVGRGIAGEDAGVGDASLTAANARGVWYLSSCAPGQTSHEDPALGGGVYTYYLADGLKGAADGFPAGKADGLVTVTEAQAYAAAKVEAWSRVNGANVQLPCRSERDVSGGEMVLSTPRPPSVQTAQAPAAPPQPPQVTTARTPTPTTTSEAPVIAAPTQAGGLHLPFNGSLLSTGGLAPVSADAVSFAQGPTGKAVVLADGCLVTYPSAGNITTAKGTLMFWIKPQWNGDDGQVHYVMGWGPGGGMAFGKDGGGFWRMLINRFDSGAREQGTGTWITQEWKANVWHHTAFTWDQTSCKVYVDGKLRESTPVRARLVEVDAPVFELGGCDNTGTLDAALCDLHILDRPLSPQEIAQAAEPAKAPPSATPATETIN